MVGGSAGVNLQTRLKARTRGRKKAQKHETSRRRIIGTLDNKVVEMQENKSGEIRSRWVYN